MAKIFFGGEDKFERTVTDGSLLQDAIDSAGADIQFGCREGSCATCMIQVQEGMAFLNPPTEAEKTTLMPDELANSVRLACQCRILGGRISVARYDGDF